MNSTASARGTAPLVDYYAVLGVRKTDPTALIRSRGVALLRAAALGTGPELPAATGDRIGDAVARFRALKATTQHDPALISAAVRTLTNDRLRRQHDVDLSRQGVSAQLLKPVVAARVSRPAERSVVPMLAAAPRFAGVAGA